MAVTTIAAIAPLSLDFSMYFLILATRSYDEEAAQPSKSRSVLRQRIILPPQFTFESGKHHLPTPMFECASCPRQPKPALVCASTGHCQSWSLQSEVRNGDCGTSAWVLAYNC